MNFPRLVSLALFPLLTCVSAYAQISVSIGQPGFYGRIDIGGFPPPPLLFAEPMIIRPTPAVYSPIYLRVPPGHARKWHRYCDRYRACGRPVYFVQDDWYRNDYSPIYRERHHHNDRREFHSDDRDHDRHQERGGRGHGHGHGRGRD